MTSTLEAVESSVVGTLLPTEGQGDRVISMPAPPQSLASLLFLHLCAVVDCSLPVAGLTLKFLNATVSAGRISSEKDIIE